MDYTCELEGTSSGCSKVANHSCRSLFQLVAHIDDRSNPYPFQHFLTRHVDMDRFGICYLITEKATKGSEIGRLRRSTTTPHLTNILSIQFAAPCGQSTN